MFRDKEKRYQFVDKTADKASEDKATLAYRLKVLEALGSISSELAKQTEILKSLKTVRGK